MRMTGMALTVIKNDGFFALYNGLSASLFRQVRGSRKRAHPTSGVPALNTALLLQGMP